MLTIVTAIIDYVFPPRGSERLIRSLSESEVVSFFNPRMYSTITYLSSYESPLMRALVTENKYYGNAHAAKLLATLLEKWLSTQEKNLVLIPIPLGKKRLRERGYNQVTRVLSMVATTIPITYDETLLSRQKETVPQTTLSKHERLRNTKDIFTCNSHMLASYSKVTFVLIDDVVTTGATMAAAHRSLTACLPPGCTVTCLALAH